MTIIIKLLYFESVVCGVWCVVCGVWCVVCGVWCVVCGVWCVVCVSVVRTKTEN